MINILMNQKPGLTERALIAKGSLNLACNVSEDFFSLPLTKVDNTLKSCQGICDAFSYLLDNIFIRFGTNLYRQIVPMDTNCAPLVADLFLKCYERDFMDSLNQENQNYIFEVFNSTSMYFDDLYNIDNTYFEGMANQIYPPQQQLNKANTTDTEDYCAISRTFTTVTLFNCFVCDLTSQETAIVRTCRDVDTIAWHVYKTQ